MLYHANSSNPISSSPQSYLATFLPRLLLSPGGCWILGTLFERRSQFTSTITSILVVFPSLSRNLNNTPPISLISLVMSTQQSLGIETTLVFCVLLIGRAWHVFFSMGGAFIGLILAAVCVRKYMEYRTIEHIMMCRFYGRTSIYYFPGHWAKAQQPEVSCVQAWYYFTSYQNDTLPTKLLVCSSFIVLVFAYSFL